MSTHTESQSSRERSWIYITACVLLAVAAIVALLLFEDVRESNRAQEKADELVLALDEAGARSPDAERIAAVLGDDGGAVCEDPNSALKRATALSLLVNGATGPGGRPVIADSRVIQGQLLIMEVYCPDELDEFREFAEDLETDDHVGN
ncbi:hypothetical protein [Aeromicrobium sp.]|uniref:hypothetical protein n=1 Tax=Aeromicrobium sp. TaxID=1871063 RepID=UPI0028A9CFB7|nr:hypothetical protein [Aeromicrobium sp.]